jgi:hypothetical protein
MNLSDVIIPNSVDSPKGNDSIGGAQEEDDPFWS